MKNSLKFKVVSILSGCLSALILVEFIIRISNPVGIMNQHEIEIKVKPPEPIFIKDKKLGFKVNSGDFMITQKDGFSWSFSTDAKGYRKTSIADYYPAQVKKKECWILGCSYTFGWSVDDEETFPWVLQEQVNEWVISNMGQPAYSTVQSLLQLKENLRQKAAPDMVILAYAAFHDERNIGSPNWTRQLAPYKRLGYLELPVVKEIKDTTLHIDYLEVAPKSSLTHKLKTIALIDLSIKSILNRSKEIDVTQSLLKRIQKVCEKSRTDFKVVIVNSGKTTPEMTSFFKKNEIEYFDFTIDTRIIGNTNEPFDSHPSEKAHKELADKLAKLVFKVEAN